MPTVSAFYGILIRMFFIDTLVVIQGDLPGRALNLAREWAMIHRDELLDAWRLCRENRPPSKIEPLA
jgi:hypothetical protein